MKLKIDWDTYELTGDEYTAAELDAMIDDVREEINWQVLTDNVKLEDLYEELNRLRKEV